MDDDEALEDKMKALATTQNETWNVVKSIPQSIWDDVKTTFDINKAVDWRVNPDMTLDDAQKWSQSVINTVMLFEGMKSIAKGKLPVKGKAVPKESLKIPEIEKIKLEKGNVKIEDINKLSGDKTKKINLVDEAGNKADVIEGGSKAKGLSDVAKVKIEEVTPPGAKNPVKVYTDGCSQVNKGKIDTYIRGKIKEPANYSELKSRISELEKLKKIKSPEFTKEMKQELKDIAKKVHNYERSKGMGELLNEAGIPDTVKNNEMIANTVLDSAKEVKAGNTKIVRYIKGTNKDVIVESWWIVDSNGTPYCSTIILKEVK